MLAGLVGGGALAADGGEFVRVGADQGGGRLAGRGKDERSRWRRWARRPCWTREEAVAWRRTKADPRAFMLMRAYVPTALKVEVTEPGGSDAVVYLSTRSPQRLAAALERSAAR